MPHYKFGYWVRVYIEAPDLKTACQAPLRPHCYVDESAPKGALVKQVAGVIVDDVEVEHEHTSVFDDDGRETGRYDVTADGITPIICGTAGCAATSNLAVINTSTI
jgi:hypothetical protein